LSGRARVVGQVVSEVADEGLSSEEVHAARDMCGPRALAFRAGRALLRGLLGRATACLPRAVPLTLEGAPLREPFSGHYGSLSHGDGYVVAAIANAPVGVDVERVRPLEDGMARQILGEAEHHAWRRLPPAEREALLIHAFSAKEAALKALGLTLEEALRDVSVGFRPELSFATTPYPLRLEVRRLGPYVLSVALSPDAATPTWDLATPA
jgi:phosphopantetheinyl transferase